MIVVMTVSTEEIQKLIGHRFDSEELLERALTHRSAEGPNNERLEFLGDGVLECITKYYLYRRFPKENEGFMTEKKIDPIYARARVALIRQLDEDQ